MTRIPALAVVVLYRRVAEQSETLRSLAAAKAQGVVPQELLVFDNEPAPENANSAVIAALGALYVASENNRGICEAYERARGLASDLGIQWLWLFDQDSVFDMAFLSGMGASVSSLSSGARCAAVMPRVYTEGRLISPLTHEPLPERGQSGLLHAGASVLAINSGMLLNRAFVDGLGGFDRRFWLDGLDHWICLKARQSEARIGVASVKLEHSLSVASRTGYVSVPRYRSILNAERILFKELFTRRERAQYVLRLLFRCVKHPIRWRTFAYLPSSLRQLARIWL